MSQDPSDLTPPRGGEDEVARESPVAAQRAAHQRELAEQAQAQRERGQAQQARGSARNAGRRVDLSGLRNAGAAIAGNAKAIGLVILAIVVAGILVLGQDNGGAQNIPAPQAPVSQAPKGTPGGDIKLPSLIGSGGEPWSVPGTALDILREPNLYATWLMAGLFIIVFLWYGKRERALEPEDYNWIRSALEIWLVLSIFADGIIPMLNGPLSYFGVRIEQPPSRDLFIALGAMAVVLVGIFRALQGERDWTPAAVASAATGMVLMWAPHPPSDLRRFGLALYGLAMVFMLLESVARDPRDRSKRLWMWPAALTGALVLVFSRSWIYSGLAGLVAKGYQAATAPALRSVVSSVGLPLAAILSTLLAIMLGGMIATQWGKMALKWVGSHVAPGKITPEFDANDAGVLMILLVWGALIALGGI